MGFLNFGKKKRPYQSGGSVYDEKVYGIDMEQTQYSERLTDIPEPQLLKLLEG